MSMIQAGAEKPPMVRTAGSVVEPVADIALLLEGTYPYVRGGVSAWVHQIINGLPEFTFAVIFIGGQKEMYGPAQYQFPPNVTHVETHYLLHRSLAKPHARKGNRQPFQEMEELHAAMRQPGKLAEGKKPFSPERLHLIPIKSGHTTANCRGLYPPIERMLHSSHVWATSEMTRMQYPQGPMQMQRRLA